MISRCLSVLEAVEKRRHRCCCQVLVTRRITPTHLLQTCAQVIYKRIAIGVRPLLARAVGLDWHLEGSVPSVSLHLIECSLPLARHGRAEPSLNFTRASLNSSRAMPSSGRPHSCCLTRMLFKTAIATDLRASRSQSAKPSNGKSDPSRPGLCHRGRGLGTPPPRPRHQRGQAESQDLSCQRLVQREPRWPIGELNLPHHNGVFREQEHVDSAADG